MLYRNIILFAFLTLLSNGVFAQDSIQNGLSERADNAISLFINAAQKSKVETEAEMTLEKRAERNNLLAWYGRRSNEVILVRDGRGSISRLSGKAPSIDFAPQLKPGPTLERAKAFFSPSGFGRSLLELSDKEDIRFTRQLLAAKGGRFEFQQFKDELPVFGATVTLQLDDKGRIIDITSHLVPGVEPEVAQFIDEQKALEIAINDLKSKKDFIWNNATPVAESIKRIVFDLMTTTGENRTRHAFIVILVPETKAIGRREVVVDAISGSILLSTEKTKFAFDANDRINLVAGSIGGATPEYVREVWRGGDVCPPTSFGIRGDTPLERDFDETIATVCEAERFFAARGGLFGSADVQAWLDPHNRGISIGVGAIPRLSVGLSTGGCGSHGIYLAAGVGRAEIIGHELGHIMFSCGGLSRIDGGVDRDGQAIEEHMVDTLGLILEKKLPGRVEDRCMMNDDSDSIAAITGISYPGVVCRGQPLPWRSTCQPWRDNTGWCEGPRTFLDKAGNAYDMGYPSPEPIGGGGTHGHGLSHTNLGIGNRVAAALRNDAGRASYIDSIRVNGIGQENFESLFLAASTRMPPRITWSGYKKAWIDGARDIAGDDLTNNVNTAVRAAMSGGQIWDLPRPVSLSDGTLLNSTTKTRPAVASLILGNGVERTYIFYRDRPVGGALFYVWRDEVAGGEFGVDRLASLSGAVSPTRGYYHRKPRSSWKTEQFVCRLVRPRWLQFWRRSCERPKIIC